MSDKASPQESAKILRRALRDAFPDVRFSLRMSRGTAWGNYHIRWTDGPECEAVERVARPFEGKGFDGRDDSTTYLHSKLPDGRESGIGMILYNRSRSCEAVRS